MSTDARITRRGGGIVTEQESTSLPMRYEPRLIEEAVFLALRGHPDARIFHRKRNRLYEIIAPEERERAFQEIHRSWFLRLGLADQIEKAVQEFPLLHSTVRCCVVARSQGKRDEGAELFIDPEERPSEKDRRTVRILLRPESLLDPVALLMFLRHELLHITDMLDSHFNYEPVLPVAEAGPAYDNLLRDRYRTLWDTTISGRMVRRGWAPASVRTDRLDEFARVFPMLGEQTAQVFSQFFDQEQHTHGKLIAFAYNPRAALGGSRERPYLGSRCSLCGFPTYVFEPNPERLPAEVISRICKDFPQWRTVQGLCRQCADLYRTGVLNNI
ncbi:MAG: hypothetical protein ACE5JU_06050 [Candidatus Binatia bacterium]